MSHDVLTLGPIVFDDFSTPAHMPFGGRHELTIHRLPGGGRVIDTLGPDDADISWHGRFFGDAAYDTALTLDAMRRSGVTLPLSFAGQAYRVVISDFEADIERLPVDVLYRITCVIATPQTEGALSALGGSMLATADLAAAVALNGGPLATSAAPEAALSFVNVPVTPALIPELVRQLPTRLPSQPGKLWNNGGVISVS